MPRGDATTTTRARRKSTKAAASNPSKPWLFAAGNKGGAMLTLLDIDVTTAAPFMRAALVRYQRVYRSALKSGIYKGTVGLPQILKAACVAMAVHDSLVQHAATLTDVAAARELLVESRAFEKQARDAFLKLGQLVGHKRGGSKVDEDPMSKLARELAEESDDDGGDGDDD